MPHILECYKVQYKVFFLLDTVDVNAIPITLKSIVALLMYSFVCLHWALTGEVKPVSALDVNSKSH